MTYNAFEKTAGLSEPAELYEFTTNANIRYYTSAEFELEVGGKTYQPVYIEHSELGQTGEEAKDEAKITVDWDNPVFQQFLNYVPTHETTVKIYGLQRDDMVDEEKIFIWSGIWTKEERKYPKAILIFKPADFEVNKEALSVKYGPDCQNSQFDNRCRLIEDDWSDPHTISSISGFDVSIAAVIDDDKYLGGLLTVGAGSNIERAWITAQSAGLITVDRNLPLLEAETAVKLTHACRGVLSICDETFANRNNFIGAPYAEVMNAFVGDGVKGDK